MILIRSAQPGPNPINRNLGCGCEVQIRQRLLNAEPEPGRAQRLDLHSSQTVRYGKLVLFRCFEQGVAICPQSVVIRGLNPVEPK